MTARLSPRSQCRNKVRHASKRAAKRAAKMLEAKYGKRLRAYHCPHCATYHLGTPYHRKEASVKGDIEVFKYPAGWGWSVRLDDDPMGCVESGFAESEIDALEQAEQARKDELG